MTSNRFWKRLRLWQKSPVGSLPVVAPQPMSVSEAEMIVATFTSGHNVDLATLTQAYRLLQASFEQILLAHNEAIWSQRQRVA